MTVDLSQGEHPAEIVIFSDWRSLLHVGVGVLIARAEKPWDSALLALFIGYQVSQAASKEPWDRTGGEFVELGIGVILGGLTK